MEEFNWLLCCLSALFKYWKLTFRLKDFEDAFDELFLANRFNRSESLDYRLLPESILFLQINLLVTVKILIDKASNYMSFLRSRHINFLCVNDLIFSMSFESSSPCVNYYFLMIIAP